ncbi:hypothetical protein [Burkholderia sp. BCC1999]|uniref:hypothetical protein n=1 Tax=Burkholderia sp. BCC1999 TaxID=2817448 RepID=UPI002AC3330F|nr:hypothetical protein [Burkholderia sp. BCC1999]
MKKQCGHIRKNDVFALVEPEENAGEKHRNRAAGKPLRRGFAGLPSLTKKRRTAKGAE